MKHVRNLSTSLGRDPDGGLFDSQVRAAITLFTLGGDTLALEASAQSGLPTTRSSACALAEPQPRAERRGALHLDQAECGTRRPDQLIRVVVAECGCGLRSGGMP